MLRHDMTSLRLFVAICEYRNLSRAAESMNLAVVWKLPAIFVVEDNGFGEATSSAVAVAVPCVGVKPAVDRVGVRLGRKELRDDVTVVPDRLHAHRCSA